MYFAKYEGGGQLPAYLGGAWTKENDLKARIQLYLQTRRAQTEAQKEEKAATVVQRKSNKPQPRISAEKARAVLKREEV